jgi:hypothetical protein
LFSTGFGGKPLECLEIRVGKDNWIVNIHIYNGGMVPLPWLYAFQAFQTLCYPHGNSEMKASTGVRQYRPSFYFKMMILFC